MRIRRLLSPLVLVLSCGLWAQSPPAQKTAPARESLAQAPRPTVGTDLLDLDDGLAVLGAALESRHKANPRSDCSHLVQSIYEKAGFPFEYQTSRDFFAGRASDFRRVTQPQPGDVIVWPGHAGVVVNPAQRTFYSSLRSGFGVQPYDSAYWKGRGRPRFYRYVKGTLPTPPVQAAASRTPALKPVSYRPDAENALLPHPGYADPLTRPVDTEQSGATIPLTVAIQTVRPRPDQVKTALDQQFRAAGQELQSRNILAVYPALIAFDSLDIRKVQLQGDEGWAEVSIRGAVLVAGADKRPKKKAEVQRWSLHRVADATWELTLPSDTSYIPRETAVHILAQQLAALTDDSSNSAARSSQKVQLAHWLNVLLN